MNTLKLAWRNLFRNVRRTFASLFTVALGSAGLLIYQGFNSGIMNQYRENTIHGYYGFGEIYPKDYYNKVQEKPWKYWLEHEEELEKELRKIPEIVELFPRVSLYAFLVKGDINLGGKGEGIVPERENKFFNQMNFIEGGEIKAEDEIILGKGLAESLGAKVGDSVTVLSQTISGQLNGADYIVAGIFHMGKKSVDDTFFRVSLKSAQKLLNVDRVEKISLSTTGVGDWSVIEQKIK
ncbi:MAG: ABC transporter permease, partial [Bdellovibrionaceae bacterium]|nr:ABC transporter permease [Pseudobdellovibrionaceae bacterium]